MDQYQCRFCMSKDAPLLHIYKRKNAGDGHRPIELLKRCFPYFKEMEANNKSLPKFICDKCLSFVEQSNNFVAMARKSFEGGTKIEPTTSGIAIKADSQLALLPLMDFETSSDDEVSKEDFKTPTVPAKRVSFYTPNGEMLNKDNSQVKRGPSKSILCTSNKRLALTKTFKSRTMYSSQIMSPKHSECSPMSVQMDKEPSKVQCESTHATPASMVSKSSGMSFLDKHLCVLCYKVLPANVSMFSHNMLMHVENK